MSTPESAWPEGAVAHVENGKPNADPGNWIVVTSEVHGDGFVFSSVQDRVRAPSFGLPSGTITIRHTAELESLRDENQRLRGIVPEVLEQINDELCEENDQLCVELQKERMRNVACGVVAMCDTESSSKEARDMHPDYRSASCDDVARRVDECIALRSEVARLQGQSEDERKITGILLAHLGLDESAAFTEAGVPNPGRLQSILVYEPPRISHD